MVQKSRMGHCPFVLQEKKNCIAGCKAKLYCKRKPLHCIVAGLRVFILQYTVLYCRKKISVLQWVLYCKRTARRIVYRGKAWTVLQYSHRAHDTSGWACWARQASGSWAQAQASMRVAGAARRVGRARQTRGARAAGRGARAAGRGRPAVGARGLCAQAGPVGCSCTRLGFQPGFSTRYFS